MAGVFGLKKVYNRQRVDNWSESANYGYFAGGYSTSGPPYAKNEIYRIDYFDETVSLPGPSLTQARQLLAGVSNSNYGYFAGGFNPPRVCTIDRIDFSSETVAVPPVGDQLTQAKQGLAGVSNSNYGYFAGGFLPTCAIDRIDFSSETVVGPPVHGASLTQARYYLTTVSSSNCGYFAGGEDVTPRCTIDRIDFSSETVTLPGSSLTQARKELAGVSNYNYGYFAGGAYSGSLCTIDRIDFSSETVAVPPVGDQLTQPRYGLAGVSNLNYGYFGGGRTTTPNVVNTIDRIDFSSETTSSPGNNLLAVRSGSAAVSGGKSINARGVRKGTDKDGKGISSTYGYFAGGQAPPDVCTIDRIDFSSETVAVPPVENQLSKAREGLAAVSNSNYGYFGGGSPSFNVDRIDFSNETVSLPTLSLTKKRDYSAAVFNSNYGYFAGGFSPAVPGRTCSIDRIDFSSETAAEPSIGNQLTQARNELTAVSSSNYGYFAGGFDPSSSPARVCTIDRIDFSSETVAVPPVGNELTRGRYGLAAVSNSNYGYFGGGLSTSSAVCTIDRIDFSNDTVDGPPVHGASLTQARNDLAGVSNSNYGYFAGGFAPPQVCTIDRIDFSTETVDGPSVHGANLTQARYGLAAVSN